MSANQKSPSHNTLTQLFLSIERAGNLLPNPVILFIWLAISVIIFSAIAHGLDYSAIHPISHEPITTFSLLNAEGLRLILSKAVTNFTQFAPVGVVLVAMMGIGIAEHSGLIKSCLEKISRLSQGPPLAYLLAFTGILSNLGLDVGYVVLLPLGGMIYHAANRPAIAGIAVTFAGVSAGFSANLIIGPADAILAGISSEAAQLVKADYVVAASANYYFLFVSTLLITIVCGWLSNHVIEPGLIRSHNQSNFQQLATDSQPSTSDAKPSFKWVGLFTIVYCLLIAALVIPENAPLHTPKGGTSYFVSSIIPILSIYFALAGYLFGRENGVYKCSSDAVSGMESAMKSMAYYLVLMFFAAQFVNYFNWTNLGLITAIKGSSAIASFELSPQLILFLLIIFVASMNLFIGSASAKWAVLAPVFIPMLMLLGIPPEETQMAYRIGDSTTNIITPLMPYFGIALAYIQQYDRNAGLGSVIATMLPYSICLFISWSALAIVWLSLDLPLGF